MKKYNKILSILIAILMTFSVFQIVASADNKVHISNRETDLIEILDLEMVKDTSFTIDVLKADVKPGTEIKIKFNGKLKDQQTAILGFQKYNSNGQLESVEKIPFDETNIITYTVESRVNIFVELERINIKVTKDGVPKVYPRTIFDETETLTDFDTVEYIVVDDIGDASTDYGHYVINNVMFNLNGLDAVMDHSQLFGKNVHFTNSGKLFLNDPTICADNIYLDGNIKYMTPVGFLYYTGEQLTEREKKVNAITDSAMIYVKDGMFLSDGQTFARGYELLPFGKDQIKISGGIFSHEFVSDKDYSNPKDFRNDINWLEKGCAVERGNLDANDKWTTDPNGKLYKVITFKILEGENQTIKDVTKGLVIRIEGSIKDLLSIYVDNKLVDPSNYTLTEGSIIVSFHEDFLRTLGNGEHTVTFNFKNGKAPTTTFTLADSKIDEIANTSDPSAILAWSLSLAATGAAALLLKKKAN